LLKLVDSDEDRVFRGDVVLRGVKDFGRHCEEIERRGSGSMERGKSLCWSGEVDREIIYLVLLAFDRA